ncbi:MAG: OadG family protein, partial [Fibrobacter sp.]|nr:OadG family protein [Fibrobacter sp.]
MNDTLKKAMIFAAVTTVSGAFASDFVAQPAASKAAKVGRFDEQIALMPDSIAAPIKEQLKWMDESTVFQIVETHGGGYSILYKTYEQSVRARDIRDSVENANGTAVLPIAKAKLGSEYCYGKMEGGKCNGEVQKFTLGKLVEFQVTGLIVVMSVIIGLLVLCTLMSFVMKKLGLDKVKAPAPAKKAAPAAAAPAPAVRAPAHCDWDPNAKSIHPGFTNKQLQAFLGIAAVAALEEH